jgi:hypothetical protein
MLGDATLNHTYVQNAADAFARYPSQALEKWRAIMDRGNSVLGIYLNDHLAGATMGVELFRRASGSAQGSVKTELRELTTEVERDRESLLKLMGALGVPVRHYKVLGGWVLEKAARFKPNGRLLSRSPLSDLIELEGLLLGVQGKAAGFRALRRVADTDPRLEVHNLDQLIDRAERQADALEQLRMHIAARVLAIPDE